MSIILVLIFAALSLFLIAQFGGKLTARNSLVWWLIFSFLFFCLLTPVSLVPLAQALGIQLVSNFVLATMILFLIFQAIQESSFSTQQARKIRDLVSAAAAESFYQSFRSIPSSLRTKVLICMPCFNESEHLPDLVSDIKKFTERQILGQSHSEQYQYLFCVVNDGSTDDCRLILDLNLPNASTSHLSNIGVAGVLLTSFKVARLIKAKYVVQCDADGQHPISEIPNLIEVAEKSGSDLLIGSRYIENIHDESSTRLRRVGSKIIVMALKLFSLKTEVRDPTSGFRVYSKNAQECLLKTMPDDYPEPETIAILLQNQLKINEHSVRMLERQGGASSLSGFSGIRFMVKVISALLGFRLRTLFS